MSNQNLDPVSVVRQFLRALAVNDLDTATSLVTDDIEWLNTGLPTLKNKRAVGALRLLDRGPIGFDVAIHQISASGNTVMTDRTDWLTFGRLSTGFPVRGTFTVEDGQIARWDDHFSVRKIATGFSLKRHEPVQS